MTDPASAATPAQGAAADLRLPRPPGVFRRFWARHPHLVDGILAAIYLFPTLIISSVDAVGGFGNTEFGSSDSAVGVIGHSILSLALTAAIFFRRRFPLWGIVVASIASLMTSATSYAPMDALAIFILIYSVPLYRKTGTAWIAYGAVMVSTLLGEWHRSGFGPALSATVSIGVFMALLLVVGINIGNRRRYVEAILDRAAQLARERDQQAQLAAVQERARIAREMHDIVAHSLSVMIALADGAAAAVTRNTEAAQKAMESSAETGRSALTEMRRLLGVLSTDQDESAESAERVPQPGTENISALVDTFRSAGLSVRYSVEGRPAIDRGQQLAVYRVVQESLTNSLRYAGVGATVDIALQFRARDTRIVVVDDGAGTPAAGNLGSGRGLVGIRQRVEIFGGEVDAAPFGSGWRVDATIPVNPDAFRTASPTKGSPEE